MTDHTPSCWIVGDEDGGRAVWEKRHADTGRRQGWTVLPMYSEAVLHKAIRHAAAEALREAAAAALPPSAMDGYDIAAWLHQRADRIAGGGDHRG